MNKTKIRNYQIFSVIFIFVLGTLLHFTYKWSGENSIIAVFSSINESVWEHVKLLYFPMLLTTIIGYIYFEKNVSNFLCSKTIGIVVSILFMIIFFFTYTGILGKNIPIIDIGSFFVSVIIGELLSYILIINNFKCNKKISLIILTLILTCFVIFTYNTPKLGLFKDPITNQYGIIKNN